MLEEEKEVIAVFISLFIYCFVFWIIYSKEKLLHVVQYENVAVSDIRNFIENVRGTFASELQSKVIYKNTKTKLTIGYNFL
jgi:hypothetical protein